VKNDFTVEPKGFADAVAFVSRWLPTKPGNPLWLGILLEVAEDGRLTLSTYDENVTSHASVAIEGDAVGTAVVSGRLLSAFVATFPNKPVQVEAAGKELILRAGRVTCSLPVMGETDYPTLPETPAMVATVDGADLSRVTGQVAPAAAVDPSKLAWTAVRLDIAPTELELIASDTYRAARSVAPAVGTGNFEGSVPAAVLAEVAKAMAGAVAVEIGLNQNLVSFSNADKTLTVRQVAGRYQTKQVRAALAIEPPNAAIVDVPDLLSAVKRAGLLKAEGGTTMLAWGSGTVDVSAAGGDARTTETVDAAYEGPAVSIAINPSNLADALTASGGKVVRIALNAARPKHAILVTDPDQSDHRYIVMPIDPSKIAAKPTKNKEG
jgi:DNA polymerase-3 subunit beta